MTAAQLKAKIKFTREAADGRVRVCAWLDFCESMLVDQLEIDRAPAGLILKSVETELVERFLRQLYDDQSRGLLEGLERLAHEPPGGGHYGAWRAGVLALLELARRQQPSAEIEVQKRLAAEHHQTATGFMNQVKRLQAALHRIAQYPVHSEPLGGALEMAEIARAALQPAPLESTARPDV